MPGVEQGRSSGIQMAGRLTFPENWSTLAVDLLRPTWLVSNPVMVE
jgi:hypothetical protein